MGGFYNGVIIDIDFSSSFFYPKADYTRDLDYPNEKATFGFDDECEYGSDESTVHSPLQSTKDTTQQVTSGYQFSTEVNKSTSSSSSGFMDFLEDDSDTEGDTAYHIGDKHTESSHQKARIVESKCYFEDGHTRKNSTSSHSSLIRGSDILIRMAAGGQEHISIPLPQPGLLRKVLHRMEITRQPRQSTTAVLKSTQTGLNHLPIGFAAIVNGCSSVGILHGINTVREDESEEIDRMGFGVGGRPREDSKASLPSLLDLHQSLLQHGNCIY